MRPVAGAPTVHAPGRPPAALNHVHTSNTVEATLSNATMLNVASTLLLVWTGLYRRRQTTDDREQNNTGPLNGPVIKWHVVNGAQYTKLGLYNICEKLFDTSTPFAP